MKNVLFCFLLIGFLASCGEDEIDDRPIQVQIDEYLTNNNLTSTIQTTASGLHYIIEEPGIGNNPTIASTVNVAYRGTLLNGNEFDSSNGVSFPLTNVIQGWQEGIPLFKRGGKGMLIIPPSLGYGAQSVGSIPANSVLVFEIELLGF